MTKKIFQKVKTIPHSPGCYKYFNKKGELIYIGKAKDLRKRVVSYFVGANGRSSIDPKTKVLVENISDVKWEVTENEIDALIFESLLIKKYKPRFNIKVKDDKDFLYVKIDLNQEFPYPELVRRSNVETNGRSSLQKRVKIFGPFTDPKLLKEGLSILRKIFLWRDCSQSKFSFYKKKNKPCLEYYIKNCNASCCNYVNANDYQKGIRQLAVFLRGGKKKIITNFEREMKAFSKNREFEKAAIYRDKLRSLQHMGASRNFQFPISPASFKLRGVGNLQSSSNVKFSNVKKIIKVLNDDLGYSLRFKKDFRIEFYDISNISGSEAVGSMIVWQGNRFNKNKYRKFKIRFTRGPNDVGMMREVLQRRLQKISNFQSPIGVEDKLPISNQFSMINDQKDASFSKRPDLIILDGGKPQLGEIVRLFQQLKINIPLISLAKREEEVVGISNFKFQISNKMSNIKFQKLNIKKDSPEGFFIQRLRDEAHRFAIGYHKNLRAKKITKSRLDEIEGIGPKFKKKLLLEFGSVEGIMKAGLGEIAEVIGEKIARRVKENL